MVILAFTLSFMKWFTTPLLALITLSSHSQSIMDCTMKRENSSDNLFVYLTDTAGLEGFNIKIGSAFDTDDLLSEQYFVNDLPSNASLVENTFTLTVNEINTSPKYVWVTLLLAAGGSKEIKLTAK